MLEIIALICIIGGIILLGVLSYIDLKIFLLPNELVLGLACCGFVFHLCTLFHYLPLIDMGLGALIGGGMLYTIRGVANLFYEEDSLGLGDVKLLTAGGLWLGPELILIAVTIGAFAGFLHGAGIAAYSFSKAGLSIKDMDLSKLSVPAGPGFAIGLFVTSIYAFWNFPQMLFS